MKTPTINIGDRQKGRLMAESIINCGAKASEIELAIMKAKSAEFKCRVEAAINPYGDGGAAAKIVRRLASQELIGIQKKPFFDISSTLN